MTFYYSYSFVRTPPYFLNFCSKLDSNIYSNFGSCFSRIKSISDPYIVCILCAYSVHLVCFFCAFTAQKKHTYILDNIRIIACWYDLNIKRKWSCLNPNKKDVKTTERLKGFTIELLKRWLVSDTHYFETHIEESQTNQVLPNESKFIVVCQYLSNENK